MTDGMKEMEQEKEAGGGDFLGDQISESIRLLLSSILSEPSIRDRLSPVDAELLGCLSLPNGVLGSQMLRRACLEIEFATQKLHVTDLGLMTERSHLGYH